MALPSFLKGFPQYRLFLTANLRNMATLVLLVRKSLHLHRTILEKTKPIKLIKAGVQFLIFHQNRKVYYIKLFLFDHRLCLMDVAQDRFGIALKIPSKKVTISTDGNKPSNLDG